MKNLFSCFFACLCIMSLYAKEPYLKISDLFVAGEAGHEIFRIPGTIVTRKGTLLAYGWRIKE